MWIAFDRERLPVACTSDRDWWKGMGEVLRTWCQPDANYLSTRYGCVVGRRWGRMASGSWPSLNDEGAQHARAELDTRQKRDSQTRRSCEQTCRVAVHSVASGETPRDSQGRGVCIANVDGAQPESSCVLNSISPRSGMLMRLMRHHLPQVSAHADHGSHRAAMAKDILLVGFGAVGAICMCASRRLLSASCLVCSTHQTR